jgi:hypothetical protein
VKAIVLAQNTFFAFNLSVRRQVFGPKCGNSYQISFEVMKEIYIILLFGLFEYNSSSFSFIDYIL